MKTTQNWVGYLDRSYQQIKQSILTRLPTHSPELTDLSENNPMIILISIFAGIAEMLNLYIDATARECFIGTARKYTSMLKLVKLIDYRVKAMIAPTVDLTFVLSNSAGVPTPHTSVITIPALTQVNSTIKGIPFYSKEAKIIPIGKTTVIIPCSSYQVSTGNNIGTSDGSVNQAFLLPDNYAYKSSQLTIGGVIWKESDSLGLLKPTDKGYIVEVFPDGKNYVVFGDGINGAIPTTALVIYADYYTTVGNLGNLPPHTITQLISTITLPTGYKLVIDNPDYSSGGSNIEGISAIRDLAPRSLRTLRRAVTWQDYKDIAKMAPGVGDATLSYCCCCAANITLYIAPKSRGIATTILRNNTYDYFSDKKLVGRKLNVLPAGITRLYLDLGVTANPGADLTTTKIAVINMLDAGHKESSLVGYSYDNSTINRLIEPSDIISLVRKVPTVLGVSINRLYLEPYARPRGTSVTPLLVTWGEVRSTDTISYKLQYDTGTSTFRLYKNTIFYATVTPGVAYNDGTIFSMTISPSTLYLDNMEWEFKIYPTYPEVFTNFSLAVDDYSIPIVDIDFATLISGVPLIFSTITVSPSTGATGICPTC